MANSSVIQIFLLARFIMMESEMTEMNFLYVHQGMVDQVVGRGTISRMLVMLKLSTLIQRQQKVDVADTPQEQNIADVDMAKSQDTSQPAGKKPKGTRKRRRKSKKANAVQQQVVAPVQVIRSENCEVSTQTDIDFEYYLTLDEAEYQDYQEYKHAQMAQKYLVSVIREEDFLDYD